MLRRAAWMIGWLLACLGGSAMTAAAAEFVPGGRPAPANWRASIVTYQPGPEYWQRFGHDAIVLRDADSGEAISFNYGLFDFAAPGFFANFARGHMRYSAGVETLERELPQYAMDGRWAIEQPLNLTPAQLGLLRDYLVWNVQRDNADYDYDYFHANCATRVRDALDRALGGALRRQLEGRLSPASLRSEALRLIAPEQAMRVAMDLALGPVADRRIDLWARSFSPLELMAALREVTVTMDDGRVLPLVAGEQELLPARAPQLDPPAAPPDVRLPYALAGLALAALLLGLQALRGQPAARIAQGLLAGSLLLAAGLAGVAMAAIWAATDHWAGWRNGNLLLLNPLALLLLPAGFGALRRHWQPSPLARRLVLLLAGLAIAECGLRQIAPMQQANAHWCLLALPVWLALAVTLNRGERAGTISSRRNP